jgi:hypothetical protein
MPSIKPLPWVRDDTDPALRNSAFLRAPEFLCTGIAATAEKTY